MKTRIITAWILSLTALILISFLIIRQKEKSITEYVSAFQDMSYKSERDFIENIPVYRDYSSPELVRELQKYNLAMHTLEVVKHGIAPLRNTEDINAAVKNGSLVSLDAGANGLFYFHNVRKEYRYLTPQAKKSLELTAERFQKKIQAHKPGLPVVKLAVSSVIRTVDYQEKIFGRKFVSVHSYGGCFDIFFDDYFVALPSPVAGSTAEKKVKKSLLKRTGYLMGDALREQFRTVLAETLLELQKEKVIYAFLEEDRRCYHITVLIK